MKHLLPNLCTNPNDEFVRGRSGFGALSFFERVHRMSHRESRLCRFQTEAFLAMSQASSSPS